MIEKRDIICTAYLKVVVGSKADIYILIRKYHEKLIVAMDYFVSKICTIIKRQ